MVNDCPEITSKEQVIIEIDIMDNEVWFIKTKKKKNKADLYKRSNPHRKMPTFRRELSND